MIKDRTASSTSVFSGATRKEAWLSFLNLCREELSKTSILFGRVTELLRANKDLSFLWEEGSTFYDEVPSTSPKTRLSTSEELRKMDGFFTTAMSKSNFFANTQTEGTQL
jgi:hypothetical protein